MNTAQQDKKNPGTSPYIKAGWDNQIGGKGFQEQTKESDTPTTFSLPRVPPKHQAYNHNINAEDLS